MTDPCEWGVLYSISIFSQAADDHTQPQENITDTAFVKLKAPFPCLLKTTLTISNSFSIDCVWICITWKPFPVPGLKYFDFFSVDIQYVKQLIKENILFVLSRTDGKPKNISSTTKPMMGKLSVLCGLSLLELKILWPFIFVHYLSFLPSCTSQS